ncbi:MAG: hypothetical protein V7607_2541 [Solirubrobacteraceae bacterium]
MWTRHTGTNQVWCFYRQFADIDGWNVFRIVNKRSGRCLTARPPVVNGTPAEVYDCLSNIPANQLWSEQWINESVFVLESWADGRCLDISSSNSSVGAELWNWTCHSRWNQAWYIIP